MQYLPCDFDDFRGSEGPKISENLSKSLKNVSENTSSKTCVFRSWFFWVSGEFGLQNDPQRPSKSTLKTSNFASQGLRKSSKAFEGLRITIRNQILSFLEPFGGQHLLKSLQNSLNWRSKASSNQNNPISSDKANFEERPQTVLGL